MIHLIINGDDFGLNENCSKAIAKAFRDGIITDTTIISNGLYFNEAVLLAEKNGFIDRIGVHFNLTEGTPLTKEIMDVPDFVNNGLFYKGFLNNPRTLNKKERMAIYVELSEQVKKIQRAGIRITHADSHHYIHNNPIIAPIVAAVCSENGINRIRLQRNIGNSLGDNDNNNFWQNHGFITTKYFCRISDIICGEIMDNTEIMVHPDFDKNGELIDRKGVKNNYPFGNRIFDFTKVYHVITQSYKDLC